MRRVGVDVGGRFTDVMLWDAAVQRDALDEYVTVEAARDVCGVVLDGPSLAVDEAPMGSVSRARRGA